MKTNSPEDAEIIIQKLPSDIGIHRNPRKGTLNAPDKILEEFKFEEDVLVDEVFPDEFSLEETQERIEKNTRELISYEQSLLSIGGDHSVSFSVIKVLKERYPELQLVWLDAHLDLKEKVDDHVSHDVVVRELLDHGFSEDEVWLVGTNRVDEDEQEFLDGQDLQVFKANELEEFRREFNPDEQPVYLSVDIDVLKEELAPGTGYPDGQLELMEVRRIVELVEPDFADLVEVAPPFDEEGNTVENAREILETLLKQLQSP